MSKHRRVQKIIRPLNDLLGQELGRTPKGDPIYMWAHTDFLNRPRRILDSDGEPVYRWQEPLEGESVGKALPIYETVPLCPHLQDQYVVLRFIPTASFEEWRKRFGDNLEWEKGGEWFPVSSPTGEVTLPPGIAPTREDTEYFIRVVKKDKETYLRKLFAVEEGQDLQEQKQRERLEAKFKEILPLWDKIPGTQDGPAGFVGCRGEPKVLTP